MAFTAKAAVLRQYGGPVCIEQIEIDDPIDDEVVVRTIACGVCHSDLHFKMGAMPHFPVPTIMGHEAAGIVERVGPKVKSVQPGDHVIACNTIACGVCKYCQTGHPNLCTDRSVARRPRGSKPRVTLDGKKIHPFTDLGGFSQVMLLPERAVVRIDKDIPLDRAALLGCAVLTGVGAAINTAQVRPGSTVAVFGCGGIGSSIVQGARIAGARKIIAVDIVQSKLEMAVQFGATSAINSTKDDPVTAIRDLTNGGVDFAFDAVGSTKLLAQCFSVLVPRGMAVLVGAIPAGQKVEIEARGLLNERMIMGSLMGSNRFQLDMPFYLDLYRQGKLNLDGLIGERLPLERLDEAFDTLEKGEAMRSIITFD